MLADARLLPELATAMAEAPLAMLVTDPIVLEEGNTSSEKQLAQDLLQEAKEVGERQNAHEALQVLTTFEMLKQVIFALISVPDSMKCLLPA